jgi:multidrug efflux pump subunit AcrA (membrane-fusion protein)
MSLSRLLSLFFRVFLPFTTAFILTAVLFSARTAAAQQGGQQGTQGPAVAVAELSTQYRNISVGGRLQPKSRIVHLTPKSGYVSSVDVEEGQFVEEGQDLFSIRRKDDVLNIYKPSVVTARITGWVSELLIQEEDEVQEGVPAVVIIGTEGYVLEANISDKDFYKVRIGQKVSALTSGGVKINGVLVSRSREPDYQTGLFLLTFNFSDNNRAFIGEFVVVNMPVDRVEGVFVRRDQIVRRYGKYYIWVVNGDGVLEAREIELGPTYGDLVEIARGLDVGEKYLSRLTGREKEGEKVEAPGA